MKINFKQSLFQVSLICENDWLFEAKRPKPSAWIWDVRVVIWFAFLTASELFKRFGQWQSFWKQKESFLLTVKVMQNEESFVIVHSVYGII